MKSLREWLGFCKHKWKIIGRVNRTTDYINTSEHTERLFLTLQCTKCGDIKSIRQ